MIKSGVYPPVLLLFGEEELLVDEAARNIYAAATADDLSGMNNDALEGEGMSLDAILMIARSFPMMGDRRVVWVRRFDKVIGAKDKKGNDLMAAYMKSPSESTFLLLTASLSSIDGLQASMQKSAATAQRKIAAQKPPIGALLKSAKWHEFPRMREAQVRTWVRARGTAIGLAIDDGAIDFLLLRCGTQLRDLALELDKLKTYVGDRTAATLDDINAIVGAGKTYNIFELQRAIGRADVSNAYTILTRMMEAERQEMLIIAMLTRYFLALFKLTDLRGSTDRADVAKRAGIPMFAVGDHMEALDRLGAARVERALMLLVKADATIKSSSSDALTVLQTALSQILEPVTAR
ncbi:MAG: DNA polymerase III subunit delta [bacterium]|nr:DNA polymerase III subunit delta [bacterium]